MSVFGACILYQTDASPILIPSPTHPFLGLLYSYTQLLSKNIIIMLLLSKHRRPSKAMPHYALKLHKAIDRSELAQFQPQICQPSSSPGRLTSATPGKRPSSAPAGTVTLSSSLMVLKYRYSSFCLVDLSPVKISMFACCARWALTPTRRSRIKYCA